MKKIKIFKGFIRKAELKQLVWSDQTLMNIGSYIGKIKDFEDDIKIKITIEEIQ